MAKYCERLTKEMLEKWGFTKAELLPGNNWYVERLWRKNNSKTLKYQQISITEAVCKHKYSTDKKYLKLTFSTPDGVKSITLSRFIYVWFKGDIEAGEVIDHINNDPYDNRPENLQKLSVGENLAKRFIDNATNPVNQYTTKAYKNQQEHPELYMMVHKMYEAGKSYEEAIAKIYKYIEEQKMEN